LFASSLLDMDAPRHQELRALVSQAFTPRTVESMTPRVTAAAHELLDRAMAAGRFDVIRDLAAPLPVKVIAAMLGLPDADWEQLKRWSDLIVSIDGRGAGSGYQEMARYFAERIGSGAHDATDDLIARLLAARDGKSQLTPLEIIEFCGLLLIAGHETTTHLIGNAMLCLTDHPLVWERLRRERTLVPQAIEEVLRYRSPVSNMPRVTTRETELGGRTIPAGAVITAWVISANHDEGKFAAPEQFDVDRSPNPHIAFGRGSHYCLGAPLARLESAAVLHAMLDRMSAITRVAGQRLDPFPSAMIFGVRRLPVAFSA
jgi:cytochrome P450